MSQCGVNIPLDDLVKTIIDLYGDDFAEEIIKRLNLAQYVKVNSGTANDLTLRQSLTVDEAVKSDLCSILQDCIADKIQEELGCERDNHVTKFYIDKEKDHLVIELKFGERYYVSRAELEEWLKVAAGGIKSGVLIIQEEAEPSQIIRVTNNDGSIVDIDVSALKDIHANRGEVVNGDTIRLHRTDGKYVDIDVSALKDIHVNRGEVVNGDTIRLHRTDGKYVDINASSLVPASSPYIVSGVMVERDGGYWLDFTRNDGTHVNVNMTDVINKIIEIVFDRVMRMGYTINTQNNHYTLQAVDFNGRTIIRANRNGDQTITIPKPSDDFVGKAVIVRKSSGDVGTFVMLKADTGVTLLPEDSTPLRRLGSSATLVYVGDGVWDVYGELP